MRLIPFRKVHITLPMVLFISITLLGQNNLELKKIDQQVWEHFISSYSSFDYQTLNSIHSDDLIRINSKEIRTAEKYKSQNTNWFKKAKKEGYQQSIKFNFEKRIITGNRAFETGYYEIKITKPDGKSSNYYARFHVMLIKESGTWKIIQDWDSSIINGRKITKDDFLKASSKLEIQETSVSTIDYIKILNSHTKEASYYYQKNWKMLRSKALEKGYIKSFRLMKADKNKNYDIILITEYSSQEQYDSREKNFKELMNEYQKSGVLLLNEIKPKMFRKTVDKNILRAL